MLERAKELLQRNAAKYSFGGGGDEGGEAAAAEAEMEAVPGGGAGVLAAERYDATNGDLAGPLRDAIDHYCAAVLRFRVGHAWYVIVIIVY